MGYKHGGREHRNVLSVFVVEDYNLVHAGESWCTCLKVPKNLRNQNTITLQPYPSLPGRLQNAATNAVRGYSWDGKMDNNYSIIHLMLLATHGAK